MQFMVFNFLYIDNHELATKNTKLIYNEAKCLVNKLYTLLTKNTHQ